MTVAGDNKPMDKDMGQSRGEKKSDSFLVVTSRFGEIEVDRDRVITVTSPILGFPESHRFVLRPHGAGSAFMWFQSIDNPALAFVVVPAGLIDKGYQPNLSKADHEELQFSDGQEPEFLVILTFTRDEKLNITANFLGPLVLNAKKRLAKQVLLDPAKYDIAFPLD